MSGENGKTEAATDVTVDRLEAIIVKKEEVLEVDGKKIRVLKWNLKQSLKLSAQLGQLIREVVRAIPDAPAGGGDLGSKVATLLKTDLSAVIDAQYERIETLITETVARGNFEDVEAARAWVAELGAGEALEIVSIIARQNIRPLVNALSRLAKDVGVIARGGAQKGSTS